MKIVCLTSHVYADEEPLHSDRQRIKRKAALAEVAVKMLGNILLIPENQKVILTTMNDMNGKFEFISQSIFLDYRTESPFDFLINLSHEAIHSHQYYTNRMSFEIRDEKAFLIFDEKRYLNDRDTIISSISPWEVEAYDMELEIATILRSELIKGIFHESGRKRQATY